MTSLEIPETMSRKAELWTIESILHQAGFDLVAGVDEVGRGACAGPLVIACCILNFHTHNLLSGLNDSKKLTPARREHLFHLIQQHALAYQIIFLSSEIVDQYGVHQANIDGMYQAVTTMNLQPDYLLIDGRIRLSNLSIPSLSVIGGDGIVACIAAASILAKVSRDRFMIHLDHDYPEYGFARHKGYSTAEHTRALDRLGPCCQHRYSYTNVQKALQNHRSTHYEGSIINEC